MIVDASVVLMAFFPDEAGHDPAQALIQSHVFGAVELHAPTLLPYEITNAVLKAVSRGRIPLATAQDILDTFDALQIDLYPVPLNRSLALAHRYQRSAYDAAYLALAEAMDTPFITGDRRLYQALHHELPYLLWIGDYRQMSPP